MKKFTQLFKKYRIQALIFLVSLPYLIIKAAGGGDFRILLTGAGYFRNNVSPYGITMAIPGGTTDVFLYSPFVGFALAPLTYLPEFIPVFAFLLVNLLMVFRIWAIAYEWLDVKSYSVVQQRWWFILTIVFALRFVLHNFEKTQMNIVVFYLCFEGLYQIMVRGKTAGAFLLGFGICLKILPIVFLPYLVYRKRIKSALVAVVFCVVLLFVPALGYGFGFTLQLLNDWWAAINPTLDKYNAQQNVGIYFYCISALVPVYFSDCSFKGISVNVINLDSDKLFFLINFIRIGLVLFGFYFLGKPASNEKKSNISLFWELSYIFLLIPLVFPHQQKYSYINLLPAFSYMLIFLIASYSGYWKGPKNFRTVLLINLVIVFILTTLTADLVWGMEKAKIFQFLKLITIGALSIIPGLAYFSPKKFLSFK